MRINKAPHHVFSVALTALLALVGDAHAQQKSRSLEEAIEVSSTTVALPSSQGGTVFFKECTPCNNPALRLSDSTRFFLRNKQVGYDEFKAVYSSTYRAFTIFYDLDSRVVTRVAM